MCTHVHVHMNVHAHKFQRKQAVTKQFCAMSNFDISLFMDIYVGEIDI